MPWDAFVFFLSPFDATFQPTVGEGVAFVEVEVTFVSEEAATILWRYGQYYILVEQNIDFFVNN